MGFKLSFTGGLNFGSSLDLNGKPRNPVTSVKEGGGTFFLEETACFSSSAPQKKKKSRVNPKMGEQCKPCAQDCPALRVFPSFRLHFACIPQGAPLFGCRSVGPQGLLNGLMGTQALVTTPHRERQVSFQQRRPPGGFGCLTPRGTPKAWVWVSARTTGNFFGKCPQKS